MKAEPRDTAPVERPPQVGQTRLYEHTTGQAEAAQAGAPIARAGAWGNPVPPQAEAARAGAPIARAGAWGNPVPPLSETWRLLPYGEGPPGEELAAGEGMLAGLGVTGRPALRWYGATRPALVIGSGQRPAEVDGAAVAAAGATLHRRASGGGAVLFVPGFLMQDIALPAGHPLFRADVSESYAWLGAVWAEALGELGVAAELIDVPAARADTRAADPLVRRACFGGRSPYEVLAGGRKLVGLSQIRRRPGALFQAGLYARWPGRELAALLRLGDDERAATAAALARRVAGLDELLAPPPAPEVIMGAFARALARRHGASLAAEGWLPEELAAARAAAARFAPLDLAATLPASPAS